MSKCFGEAPLLSGSKIRKVPQAITDITAEIKSAEDLISDLCAKLNDPEFDLKQLQVCLCGIRHALDGGAT